MVLSFLPTEMLSFSWNAPPELPNVRKDRGPWVVIQLTELASGAVQVRLTHLGWKRGEERDQAYRSFDRAWALVLAQLQHRFEVGPIDWSNPWRPPGV